MPVAPVEVRLALVSMSRVPVPAWLVVMAWPAALMVPLALMSRSPVPRWVAWMPASAAVRLAVVRSRSLLPRWSMLMASLPAPVAVAAARMSRVMSPSVAAAVSTRMACPARPVTGPLVARSRVPVALWVM